MLESLFTKYLQRFMPKLQRLIETVNGKRNGGLTYLFKSMLRTEYSPDNKWESTTADTNVVAADFVSMDSELPIKKRDSIATANGKLPKVGISKVLKESDIVALNIMEAQGGNTKEIARKLAQDPVACANGIDERNEYNFLYALCNGYVAVKDEDNPNPDVVMRLNFNYLDKNTYGASVKGEYDIGDIKGVIEKADENGDTIKKICISKRGYDALRKTRGAKEMVADFEGKTYTDSTTLATPTPTRFNDAFEELTGVKFEVINRSVQIEVNGKRTSQRPWDDNRMVFLTQDIVGTLVYGRLAEQTNPVDGVIYQTIDNYKLIARFRETNPLRETTTGQAMVAPIIENVDQIYILDISEGNVVDATEEAKDTDDVKTTLLGGTYTKEKIVGELKKLGISIRKDATDEAIIKAVNTLSTQEQATLKEILSQGS